MQFLIDKHNITVKDTAEDIEAEEICNELGLNEEEK